MKYVITFQFSTYFRSHQQKKKILEWLRGKNSNFKLKQIKYKRNCKVKRDNFESKVTVIIYIHPGVRVYIYHQLANLTSIDLHLLSSRKYFKKSTFWCSSLNQPYDSAMKFGSKVRSFLSKLRRSNRFKCYYVRYQRLVEHHLSDEDEDKGPRIYVTAMVGQERKRYDVPLMYISLPWFQQLVIGSEEERDLGQPILVDCTPEMFELFLELWSFKWDFDEGNYFIFLKKFEKWSRVRDDYLTSATADIAALIQNSNHSSPDSIAES